MADILIPYYAGEQSTLDAFRQSVGVVNDFTAEDVLNYSYTQQSPGGAQITKSNADAIYANYTNADKAQYSEPVTTLVRGLVWLAVPQTVIDREILSTGGNVVVPNVSTPAFLADKVKAIINAPGYKPATQNSTTAVYRVNNNISIWAWCKALGKDENGGWIDLTKFIETVETTHDFNGGHFSFSLSPAKAVYNPKDGWHIDESTTFLADNSQLTRANLQKPQQINRPAPKVNIEAATVSAYDRQKWAWTQILNSNDLVFIRFEVLEAETAILPQTPPFIPPEKSVISADIPGKVYDMIGLINSVAENMNPESNQVSFSVQGTDLIKLLIDDGVYFYPLSYYGGDAAGFFRNQPVSSLGRSVERLVSGDINEFNAYVDRSIAFSLQFILRFLSNIQIAPDSIFAPYGNDRTWQYDPNSTSVNDNTPSAVKTQLAAGIWQIIKLQMDSAIANRRLVDSSLTTDSGSLLNFVRKVCQPPFVEFLPDTYGDQYYFMVRKAPFDQAGFSSLFTIEIDESTIVQSNLNYSDNQVPAWFRLIPQGNYAGNAQTISLYDFPAVWLRQYADIWGARPLEIVSNYIDFQGEIGSSSVANLRYLRQQSLQDLEFVIQSTAYLPFTRQGRIVIRPGDRRIKTGMRIYMRGTDEYYYVEGVRQVYAMGDSGKERITELTLGRGMVATHLDKYFNIVYFSKGTKENNTGEITDTVQYQLQVSVFDFFIKRLQFSDNPPEIAYQKNAM